MKNLLYLICQVFYDDLERCGGIWQRPNNRYIGEWCIWSLYYIDKLCIIGIFLFQKRISICVKGWLMWLLRRRNIYNLFLLVDYEFFRAMCLTFTTRALGIPTISTVPAISSIQSSHPISTYRRINDSGFYTR